MKSELYRKNKKSVENKKKEISNNLIDFMKDNEIDCFAINDGNLSYVKQNVKKPLNKKNLLDIISNFYDGDILKATNLNNYIMDNREEYTKETIQRRLNKCDKEDNIKK